MGKRKEDGRTRLRVINIDPLPGNEIAPPLKLGEVYPLLNILEDSQENEHYDVGLLSKYNFIRSYETKEELYGGHLVHWCHPSRFELTEDAVTVEPQEEGVQDEI